MAKIGRNEPCPCGSGKKYKKCCINKPLNESDRGFSRTRANKKSRKGTFSQQLDPSDMTTDAIFTELNTRGVPINKLTFLGEILRTNSAIKLASSWQEKYNLTDEEEFLPLAVITLWMRLASDHLSTEKLDSLILQGYSALKNDDVCEACDKWLEAWSAMERYVNRDMKTIDDLQDLFGHMLHSLDEFVQDLEMYLWNAGIREKRYHHARIKFCEAFCRYFPEEGEIITLNMQRAIGASCFVIGEIEKGEATFEKLVAKYPMNVWGYISWGDAYVNGFGMEKNLSRAKEIYEMALGKGMEDEADVIERIESLERAKTNYSELQS